ncbi:GFA family protein [uncultured Roseobacter sp.]|uniref:GFA family protein n=1 Tax=uncultured Roseobacter sp. TaxID=114847 RepID=UPI00262ECA53|nr:GFA family protein [uncultured Roseobacter sp.]
MSRIANARCLCGAVKFSARLPDTEIHACHCAQCQRWTGGGPLLTVRVQEVSTTGADAIRAYHASAHGERAFCGICGTTLYWKMQGHDIAYLPVGLFEDQSGLAVGDEIFVDHRPSWLPAWPEAAQRDEAEMQTELAAFLEGDAK